MSRRIPESRFPEIIEDLARVYEAHARDQAQGLEAEGDGPKEQYRPLEIKALKLSLASEEAVEWANTQLLDALRFLNGRPLERTPNLHFLAEEAVEKGATKEKNIQIVATNLADREIRRACEHQIRIYQAKTVGEGEEDRHEQA